MQCSHCVRLYEGESFEGGHSALVPSNYIQAVPLRLDWLLEGLASEELELRSAAHRELAGLAGDDFGYRPDADKRSRQRSIEVWQQWWVEEQQRTAHPKAAARL
jgi:hypothetical protein